MQPIRWSSPEYEERERTPDWFWGLGLGALTIIIAAVYFHNYLFAVLIGVSAFSLGLFAVRKPRHIDYELSEKGLRIGEILYPWNTLESFWVEEHHGAPKIIIESKKFFMSHIIAPIPDHEPSRVREYLLEHLPEVEHHEPLVHIIAERLGL